MSVRARSEEAGEESFGGSVVHEFSLVTCIINGWGDAGLDELAVDEVMR